MSASTSIAQEYYKVQEYWEEIDSNLNWRLAIWVAQYQDIDILDKFMEVERSPVGMFSDIFFRFETEYKGDDELFEKGLWEEYIEWFTEQLDPSVDILLALKNEDLLIKEYQVNQETEKTAANLWKEMLRFKSCIKDLEEDNFCIYFPPTRPDGAKLTGWFSHILKEGVPKGIRLVTIDYAEQRKVKISASSKVVLIKPKLNMVDAINYEMDKDSNRNDAVGVESRFRKQIRTVMDCTLEKDSTKMGRETGKLLSLSKEMGSISALISGLLVTSQAYYSIGNHDKCEKYADNALQESEKAMKAEDPTGYPIWKAAMLLKAAVLWARKHRKEAIGIYNRMAEEASLRGDVFYAMEGYRLCGQIYYELGELNTAFEHTLLALVAGGYQDVETRRHSTFLHAAALALHLANKERSQVDINRLEQQLQEWLGDDWRELVQTEEMDKIKKRRKASLF